MICILLTACQTTQEKNAIILKSRVDALHKPPFKPLRCEYRSELSPAQAQKYRTAFSDEAASIDDWNVVYEWLPRSRNCQVHAKPLTPVSANQRVFVEEALCTLMQVFWVHSPFDGLRILPTDVEDRDEQIFIRQKEDSDIGITFHKVDFTMETKTAKNGTLRAAYARVGDLFAPTSLEHQTTMYHFAVRDFEWGDAAEPPKSLWINIGEMQAPPVPHTKLVLNQCSAL